MSGSGIYENCSLGIYGVLYGAVQAKTCGNCTSLEEAFMNSTQHKIWNTVRVPASEYTMNRGAVSVYTPALPAHANVNWNQYSDRAVAAQVRVDVPRHGNSAHSSITRMRPGSTSAAGAGVDVKHGSYARYLARLKGRGPLRAQNPATAAAAPLYGNKTMKYAIVNSACVCPAAV